MEFLQLFLFFHFCLLSFSQSTTSSSVAVTVTSISTLAIIILPSSDSSTSYTPTYTIPSTTSTTSTTSESSTSLVLQTVPYTGQSMLVGTCQIAQYTGLALQNGAVIEVPLVGCSDDRPECCPSLSPPETPPQVTTTSYVAAGANVPTATGVISMLSASPLSVCPSDFVDIDPVCCPSGYQLYGTPIVGNQPCYSFLYTSIPIPSSVSSSIISAVAETASSATATVSVIINQVFALGLPCENKSSSGLSTGTKAGIGAGAGVAALIILGLTAALFYKKRKEKAEPIQAPAPGYYAPVSPTTQQEKHISTSTAPMPSPMGTYMSPSPPLQSPPRSFGFPGQPQTQPFMHSTGSAQQEPKQSFDPNQIYPGWQERQSMGQPQHMSHPPQYVAPPVHEMLAPSSS